MISQRQVFPSPYFLLLLFYLVLLAINVVVSGGARVGTRGADQSWSQVAKQIGGR